MSKIRTTISLSQASHRWLRDRTQSTGEMAEYIESLIQKERTLGPIETRIQKQADRLDAIGVKLNAVVYSTTGDWTPVLSALKEVSK
jgi:hypothetical protein